MQQVLDEKEKVMEAFLQNPDFRNYGIFAQGNINAYSQYPKPDQQGLAKDSMMKAYTQADMKSPVPLGLLSQMSRQAEVNAPNLMHPNLNLMRPKPDEVMEQAQNLAIFESLRVRLNEQAFAQQQHQQGKMKPSAQQHQSVAAAFRRNMSSPHDEGHSRSNMQGQNQAAFPQVEPHPSASSAQSHQLPPRTSEQTRSDVTRTSNSTNIPTSTMPSHARSVHTPVTIESPTKNIPPESVAAFMRAMQNLTSTEVGKAVIPPETLTDIMQAMQNKAEEIMAQNTDYVRIKSEFGVDDQRAFKDLEHFSSVSGAKMRNDSTGGSHDMRMKGMPLVVQPQGDPKGLKSPDPLFACTSIPHFPPEQSMFPTNMSTKPKKPKERNHICLMCNMAFAQKNHLQIHERRHTGEKPYRCTMCEAAFARKDGLVIHQRKHTGERPYKCTFCESAFTRKDKMIIHERTHTGEKPYQCNQCDSKYTRKDKLTLHLKKHALAARRELEKVLQSTSAVVSSLSGVQAIPQTGAHLPSASGGTGSSAGENASNIPFSIPNTVSNPGLQNTIAANLSIPSAVASNVQNSLFGNLTLQNAVAANLNAVAANLSLQSAGIGNNMSLNEAAPANLSLHDSTVSNLSMQESGAANLTTTS